MNKHSSKARHLGNTAIAVVDQAMLSGLNFAVSIILLSNVEKTEYGYYSIAFSGLLFLISIQNAIISTPIAVLLPEKKEKSLQNNYIKSLLDGQFVSITTISIVLIIAIYSLYTNTAISNLQASITIALIISANGILYKEFFRALFFIRQRPEKTLKIDVLYVCIFAAITIPLLLVNNIHTSSLILSMGVSSIICGVYYDRIFQYTRSSWKTIYLSYCENWQYGRWAIAGVIVTHIQNYSYLYLIAALAGSEAVADVSVSRLILMPLTFIQIGWNKLSVPRGAYLNTQGNFSAFLSEQYIAAILFSLLVIIYIIIATRYLPSINTLIKSNYTDSGKYLPYWGVTFIIEFIALSAINSLLVIKQFKIISLINTATMLITLASALILIPIFHIEGALISLILGQFTLAIALWNKLINNRTYSQESLFSR